MAVEHANERFNTAAAATPNSGSTTQSSESADRVGIANADSVVLRDGQISLAIENSGSSSWSETSTVVISRPNANGYHAVQLSQTVSGIGNLYLNTYTDIDNSGNDEDYLVGGTWVFVDEVNRRIQVGAFADGSEQAINLPTSATATYSGNAHGIRLNGDTASDFSAAVLLNADFDTSTIDGIVTGNDLPSALTLAGENGNINNGRFDGDTSIADGYTGKWGGEFYGEDYTSAAGTFGASKGTAGDADSDSFIGFFGTALQITPTPPTPPTTPTGPCNAGTGPNTGTYDSDGLCIATPTTPAPQPGDAHVVRLTQVLETGGTLRLNTYITSGNPNITIRMEDVSTAARNVTVGEIYRDVGTFVTIDGQVSQLNCLRYHESVPCRWEHSGVVTVAISPCDDSAICDFTRVTTTTNIFTPQTQSRLVHIPEGTTVAQRLTTGVMSSNFPVKEIVIDGVIGKYSGYAVVTLTPLIGDSIVVSVRGCDRYSSNEFNNCATGTGPSTIIINERRPDDTPISSKYRVTEVHNENYYFEPYDGQTVAVVEGDTDYMSGGTWVYFRPEDGSIEIGAFNNSPETLVNLPRSGTATYNGNAYGIHLTNRIATDFTGRVRLEADFTFGSAKITGMITSSELPNPVNLGVTNFNRQNIDYNHFGERVTITGGQYPGRNFGSFGGDANMEDGYQGTWDAQLYGENASSAAGTFSVVKGDNARIGENIIAPDDYVVPPGGEIRQIEIYDTFEGEAFIGYFDAEVDPTTSTIPSE